uniref:Odorant receptor n=1 Tax=Phlebotomus papatasi TaxID=29031 RepID=A0A3F2ZEQ6_PHLPP
MVDIVEYIECYPEYQKFEEFLKCLIRFLNLSCIPWKIVRGYGKYIFPISQIYSLISSVFALVYFEKDLMGILISVTLSTGFFQVFIKTLSIITQSNRLEILFRFIQEMHQVHENDLIPDSARIHLKHLKKSLNINKIILRILFAVSFMTAPGVLLYFLHTDLLIVAVPGVFPSSKASLIYQHIHQGICMGIATIELLIPDVITISIGLYLIAVLNIFQDIIQHIHKFDFSKKEDVLIEIHKFHSNILEIFRIFSDIFYYTIAVQTATSVVFVYCEFFIILSTDFMAFIPMVLYIFVQFIAVCIFGEMMYSKTEKLTTDFYLTNWYELDIHEQKILLMMMYMSHKIIGLKAAGMYDINLRMFIETIKAGISFLTILYTLT